MLEHKCFPWLPFPRSWLCSYDQHATEAWAAEAGWGTGIVNQTLSNITLLLWKMFFLNSEDFGLFGFWGFFYVVLLQCGFAVQSFLQVLIYPHKYSLFPFHYKSRKSWASTGPVLLLGCPAALGWGQPHICGVPGGCAARNPSSALCQEEQGQHAEPRLFCELSRAEKADRQF